MKRRNFLSMLSVGALATLVPKRTYFFVNGLWTPDYPIFYETSAAAKQWMTDNNIPWVLMSLPDGWDGNLFK